jgi:hypothetical protein
VHLRDVLSEVIALLEEDKRKEIGEGNANAGIRAAVWQERSAEQAGN